MYHFRSQTFVGVLVAYLSQIQFWKSELRKRFLRPIPKISFEELPRIFEDGQVLIEHQESTGAAAVRIKVSDGMHAVVYQRDVYAEGDTERMHISRRDGAQMIVILDSGRIGLLMHMGGVESEDPVLTFKEMKSLSIFVQHLRNCVCCV